MQKQLQNINWRANLIKPNELGKFVTHSNEYDADLPVLHEKFKVNRIEKFRPFMKFPLLPHRKPVFDFLFLKEGKAVRTKGIDTYNLSVGTFFFLPAYEILANENMSEDVQGFYGHFDIEIFSKKLFHKDFLQEFPFLRHNGYPMVQVPPNALVSILGILERLEIEYDTGAKKGMDLICSYLISLFLELKNFCENESIQALNAAAQITQQYKEALGEYIYEYQKVYDYAQLLAVSPNHLNRSVQQTLGKSAQSLLFDVLLLEVKVLLKQSNLSINEIAFKLGKKDHSDFSRFFKSKVGMTPKEYRNS